MSKAFIPWVPTDGSADWCYILFSWSPRCCMQTLGVNYHRQRQSGAVLSCYPDVGVARAPMVTTLKLIYTLLHCKLLRMNFHWVIRNQRFQYSTATQIQLYQSVSSCTLTTLRASSPSLQIWMILQEISRVLIVSNVPNIVPMTFFVAWRLASTGSQTIQRATLTVKVITTFGKVFDQNGISRCKVKVDRAVHKTIHKSTFKSVPESPIP